ncbi:hypothetical protein LXL04_009479 [Taraxacum kok-saghyz]
MLSDETQKCENPCTTIQIMEFARTMDMFPNVFVAYKILLTIPVMVVFTKISFSRLKFLKSYLRNTQTQERLNSIESEFLQNLDYSKIIEDFVSKDAQRHRFRSSANAHSNTVAVVSVPAQNFKKVFSAIGISATTGGVFPQPLLHQTIQKLIEIFSDFHDSTGNSSQPINNPKPRNNILKIQLTQNIPKLFQHLLKLPSTLPFTILLSKRHSAHHIIRKC